MDADIFHQAVIRRLLAGIIKLEVRKELDRRFAFGVNPAEEKPLDVNVLLDTPFRRVEIILCEATCRSPRQQRAPRKSVAILYDFFGLEVQVPIPALAGEHEPPLIPLRNVVVVLEIRVGCHLAAI